MNTHGCACVHVCTSREKKQWGRILTVECVEGGIQTRTEYVRDHPCHGQIDTCFNGSHVRTQYIFPHPRQGQILYLHQTLLEAHTIEYEEGTDDYGTIEHWEAGMLVKKTHMHAHPQFGEIEHYGAGVHLRTEYEEGHPKHGFIDIFDDESSICTRTEYAEWHEEHGRTDWYHPVTGRRTHISFDLVHTKKRGQTVLMNTRGRYRKTLYPIDDEMTDVV